MTDRQPVRDYWDEKLENNPLRTGAKETDAGAFLSWQLEAAGDIIRELAKEPGYVSFAYIDEKVKRIEKELKSSDWRYPLSPGEAQRLEQVKKDLPGLPAPDKITQAAKSLVVAITERNLHDIGESLKTLKPLLIGEQYRPAGEKIAAELHLYYGGPWVYKEEFIGHTMTDKEVTGTTFVCKDLEDCRKALADKWAAFDIEKSVERRKLTGEMIKEMRERGLMQTEPLPFQLGYPTVITMPEYRSEWQPAGWKLLVIGPTSTWREEWGAWEAIRDIVQNCLDEAESYESGYDRLGFWIADQGKGVAVADFLLGPPRLKPDYARGKYGEGMKIAALAMVRAGYPVHVQTREKELWIVFIEQPTGEHEVAESLAALWRPQPDKSFRWGTHFHFIGYNGPDFKYRFAVNLPKDAAVLHSPTPLYSPYMRYNNLIEFAFPHEEGTIIPGIKPADFIAGNRIFCRDIYFRTLTSVFSYNQWGFELAPDRHGPKDEEAMWIDMGRTWACCTDMRLLTILFQMIGRPPMIETDESHHLSMDTFKLGKTREGKRYLEIMEENVEVWQAAWNQVFGDGTVLRTQERWDNIVEHLGYKSHSVNHWMEGALARILQTDQGIVDQSQERLREVKIITDNNLKGTQLASLELARKIVLQNDGSREVKGVHAALIPPASDRVRTAGMYATTLREIYINLDQLDHGWKTVDTTIHELAHHRTGAEDLEEAHAAMMSRLAGIIVQETASGVYDEWLRNPSFVW